MSPVCRCRRLVAFSVMSPESLGRLEIAVPGERGEAGGDEGQLVDRRFIVLSR